MPKTFRTCNFKKKFKKNGAWRSLFKKKNEGEGTYGREHKRSAKNEDQKKEEKGGKKVFMQLIGPHPNFKQVRNLNIRHGTCSDVIRCIKWWDEGVAKFYNFLARTFMLRLDLFSFFLSLLFLMLLFLLLDKTYLFCTRFVFATFQS